MGIILLVVLVLLLLGAIPSWPHSRSWGYGPSGGLGLVLIIVLAIFDWVGLTYYLRGEFYREKSKDYVGAAIATGVSEPSTLVDLRA